MNATTTKKRPRGRPSKLMVLAGGDRPAAIAFEQFDADAEVRRLITESPLKNATTKELLAVEAVILHQRLLHLRARAETDVLTGDEARSLGGLQRALLDTYRMLRVEVATIEEEPL